MSATSPAPTPASSASSSAQSGGRRSSLPSTRRKIRSLVSLGLDRRRRDIFYQCLDDHHAFSRPKLQYRCCCIADQHDHPSECLRTSKSRAWWGHRSIFGPSFADKERTKERERGFVSRQTSLHCPSFVFFSLSSMVRTISRTFVFRIVNSTSIRINTRTTGN